MLLFSFLNWALQYWSSSASSNVNFLQGMVDEGNKRGVTMGKLSCLHCIYVALHLVPINS